MGARTVQRESVIFPRYHQLDAVGRLVTAAGSEGTGCNYLIQHSAGSGKTNSISWLSHRLASLHDAGDAKVFDCVVVITDRRVLDQQLQDAIYQIEHAQGVVKAIDQDSQQLTQALVDGTKIVITTLQKFPFVLKGLLRAAGAADPKTPTEEESAQTAEWRQAIARRTYAVIVDEAHSSQSGESAREMKAILGARAQEAAGKPRTGRTASTPSSSHAARSPTSPSSPSRRPPRARPWSCSASPCRAARRGPSTSTACGRRSRRASSSTCYSTTSTTTPTTAW